LNSAQLELIYNNIFKEHDTGMHPENHKRLEALEPLPITKLPYDEKVLSIIHGQHYIDKVKEHSLHSRHLDQDTVTSPQSYQAAVYAANATIMASENNDFAVVRPPGHHAYPHHSSGFCLFNNVAIASQKFVNEGKRVLIIDFDGHLGDGTSEIFYDSDKVLYWSLHQFPAFPGHGRANEIGKGKGEGFTFNVPLPPHSGDDIFFDAFNLLLPIAKQFNPDVVALSAGFDSHQHDLLLDLRLTVDAFYDIGKILAQQFTKLFATLEGGYNVQELPKCLFNFVNGINGKSKLYTEPKTDSDFKVWDEYEINLNTLLAQLKNYWTL
jgi:acetoin utilization deacetylase AcuC-like enzyme